MLVTLFVALLLAWGIAPSVGVAQLATEANRPSAEADADVESDVAGGTSESESIDEATDAKAFSGPYQSPYRLTFKVPLHDLLFDAKGPRGSAAEESSVPHQAWYSRRVKQKWGSWGVPPRKFDCPPQVAGKPVEWRRERVVAAATRFVGYEYQHHHVPDWDPPAGWPWQQCCAGRNGKGLDCSNFSGWNYNWALGIHLNTDVHKQAALTKAPSIRGEVHAETIHRPAGKPRRMVWRQVFAITALEFGLVKVSLAELPLATLRTEAPVGRSTMEAMAMPSASLSPETTMYRKRIAAVPEPER
jgi:hypothetical protein